MKQIIIVAILSIGFILSTIGVCLYEFNKYTTASTAYISNLHKQVDSLNAEIQLRDILLSNCKDTSYGEEPIYNTSINK